MDASVMDIAASKVVDLRLGVCKLLSRISRTLFSIVPALSAGEASIVAATVFRNWLLAKSFSLGADLVVVTTVVPRGLVMGTGCQLRSF
jgi:hypothetical protein